MSAYTNRAKRPTFAPDWTEEQRAEYKRAYAAGEPVLMPHAEHFEDECEHCELLWELQREADNPS